MICDIPGCFPLSQNFRKFRTEVKWKGPFRFAPTGIFGTTSGGGPLWPVGSVRPKRAFHLQKFSFPVAFHRDATDILVETNVNGTLRSGWKLTFDEKCFIFPWFVPLVSDLMVRHYGKHPLSHSLSFTTLPLHSRTSPFKFGSQPLSILSKNRKWIIILRLLFG